MSLYDDLATHLDTEVDTEPEYDPPDRFWIQPDDGDLVVSGVWSRPPEPDTQQAQDELDDYIDRGESPPDDLWDQAQPDIDTTQRHTLVLDGELAHRARTHLRVFDDAVTLDAQTTLDHRELVFTEDKQAATAHLVTETPSTGVFDELAHTTALDADGIPSPDAVTEVEVRFTGFDTDEDDNGLPYHHDYTVWFETETPHEYWQDVDTLDEYAAMVADNNDDVTAEDVLAQDTYHHHVHLFGSEHADPVAESVATQRLTTAVDVECSHRVSPTDVVVSREHEEVAGSLIIPIE